MNKTIAIITPCFNENVTIIKFLEALENTLCKLSSDKFIIMDSDGEDDPQVICELLKYEDHDIVHVSRGKRSESVSLKIFYNLMYRKFNNY